MTSATKKNNQSLRDDVAAIILAGGPSSRMKQDKAKLVTPSGETLLQHAVNKATSSFSHVAISAPAKRYEIEGTRFVEDMRSDLGPCAGIEAGLHWAESMCSKWLLSCPVDLPLMPISVLEKLIDAAEQGSHVAAHFISEGGAEPLCAAWRVDGVERVSQYLDEGGTSVHGLHAHLGSKALGIEQVGEPEALKHAFLNVNSPEDYEAVLALWR